HCFLCFGDLAIAEDFMTEKDLSELDRSVD
ncbi:MAG: hypothetical protein PWP16_1578, partial [Eubacteriaceae bacterium]|nr:hypothetical protein [Eubacteriaceae bacterium]